MAQTRNPVKQSGDVHPPEVEYDLDIALDEEVDDASLAVPQRVSAVARPIAVVYGYEPQGTFETARQQVRAKPWLALLAALGLGLLLARLFR